MNTHPRSDVTRATSIEITDAALVLHLEDERVLTVPLRWFPRLRSATPEQRSRYRFIGGGTGIHWPEIDEDLSVRSMLVPNEATATPAMPTTTTRLQDVEDVGALHFESRRAVSR